MRLTTHTSLLPRMAEMSLACPLSLSNYTDHCWSHTRWKHWVISRHIFNQKHISHQIKHLNNSLTMAIKLRTSFLTAWQHKFVPLPALSVCVCKREKEKERTSGVLRPCQGINRTSFPACSTDDRNVLNL